ncbi:hypothetical protein NEIRO03_2066, partial [Nematocida sp. AWRm78]
MIRSECRRNRLISKKIENMKIKKRRISHSHCIIEQVLMILLFLGYIWSNEYLDMIISRIDKYKITCPIRGVLIALPYETILLSDYYVLNIASWEDKFFKYMDRHHKNPSIQCRYNNKSYLSDYSKATLSVFKSKECIEFNTTAYSFYTFICPGVSKKNIDDDYKVLASLFLLSEGLNLPLKFEITKNSAAIILKSRYGENILFKHIKILQDIIQSGVPFQDWKRNQIVSDVINFFMKYCGNPVIEPPSLRKPNLYRERITELLNCSPSYLIQAILILYLKNKKNSYKFNFEVYNILCEYLPLSNKEIED